MLSSRKKKQQEIFLNADVEMYLITSFLMLQ